LNLKVYWAIIQYQIICGIDYRNVENALQTNHTSEDFLKNPCFFIEEYEWRIAFSSAGLTQINKEFGGILCKAIMKTKLLVRNFQKLH
jgi:hypothetical protein